MNSSLTIRLTKREKECISLLVSQGKYINKSDFVRQAIRAYLRVENMLPTEDKVA